MKNHLDVQNNRGEGVSRREFVKLAVAGAVASSVIPGVHAADTTAPLPMRKLGRTGQMVSAIGLGGHHIGIQRDEQDSITIVRKAIDNGINFLDNCWDYNGGRSEERMGKALLDGYRAKVFLMTKIDGRTKAAATSQLEDSLRRFQTDHIDLVQFHEIIRMEDPAKVFAPGAALEVLLDAKKAGKVRFIGFTGHKDPAIHLKMLDFAASHQFRFDTVQMPLNVMDAHFRSFAANVVPRLVKEEIGVLGMKPLGSGAIVRSGAATAPECLRYAMHLPTSVVITGIDTLAILDQALQAARTFKPMSDTEVTALLARTKDPAADGQYERFKTSTQFDGTSHNPQWQG